MFENHVHSHGNGFVARTTDSPLGPAANRANAVLIAAAPEMYALLDDIAEQRVSGLSMYAAINKLLAKARGEAK